MVATKGGPTTKIHKQGISPPIVKTGPFYPSDPATTRSPPPRPPSGGKNWTPSSLDSFAKGGSSAKGGSGYDGGESGVQ